MYRPLLYRFQYRKTLWGNLKKVWRKKKFLLKSMTKLEDLTVSMHPREPQRVVFLQLPISFCNHRQRILKFSVEQNTYFCFPIHCNLCSAGALWLQSLLQQWANRKQEFCRLRKATVKEERTKVFSSADIPPRRKWR